MIKHITRDGKFNPADMLNEYFNKWKATIGEKIFRHKSRQEISSFDKIINPYDYDNERTNPLLDENSIKPTPQEVIVKEIIPRVRINERIKLLVSLNQKLRILFFKWKNLSKIEKEEEVGKRSKEDNMKILRKLSKKLSRQLPHIKKLKPNEIRRRNRTIANAMEIRKKSIVDVDQELRKSYNTFFSNVKKEKSREYFKRLFKKKLDNEIPQLRKQLTNAKLIPKGFNYLRLYLLKNYFKKLTKNLLSYDMKFSKMLKKIDNKEEILPSLRNIAASFIQKKYRNYRERINKQFRVNQLSKLFMNLDDDNILKLLFTRKWRYRNQKDKQNSKDFQNSFKRFFNMIV